jgi:hypothetical protein
VVVAAEFVIERRCSGEKVAFGSNPPLRDLQIEACTRAVPDGIDRCAHGELRCVAANGRRSRL